MHSVCTVELLRGFSANLRGVREMSVKFHLEGGMGQQDPLFGKRRTEGSGEDLLCRLECSNSNHLSHQFWLGHLMVCTQT